MTKQASLRENRVPSPAEVRCSLVRVLPSLSPAEVHAVKQEAMRQALEAGAAFGSVDVFLEINLLASTVSAVAVGRTCA